MRGAGHHDLPAAPRGRRLNPLLAVNSKCDTLQEKARVSLHFLSVSVGGQREGPGQP